MTSKNRNQNDVSLAPFFNTNYEGFFNSIEITPEIFDKLQEVKVGGQMIFRTLKSKETKVGAYLDYRTPETVAQRKKDYLARKNSANGSGPRSSSNAGGL